MDSTRTEGTLDALLNLFETELAAVSFPDLDLDTLRRADEELTVRKANLAHAEAAIVAARRAVDDARSGYERVGRKAVAYALVYADGDDELAPRLDAIARELASSSARADASPAAAPKRRGRPRKADSSLFDTSSGTAAGIESEDASDAEGDAGHDEDTRSAAA